MKTKISKPTVETITAEINVVKIGNKQMTISVFNQLYIEKCWDDEYNILYPVWGKIKRDSEYIIFQKNNELRKCEIPKKQKIEFYEFAYDFIQKYKNLIKQPVSYFTNPFFQELNLLYNLSHGYDKSLSWVRTIEKVKIAYSVLDEKLKKECDEQFQSKNWLIEKQNKMVFDLNNSRQLFIAI